MPSIVVKLPTDYSTERSIIHCDPASPSEFILCWQCTEPDDRARNTELPFLESCFVNLCQVAWSKPLSWQ